ncbi:MAG: amidohydrolase [Betaproteobacteria bacterium]|nr:amidohydrolase [Betaproteobacteria bacterium]
MLRFPLSSLCRLAGLFALAIAAAFATGAAAADLFVTNVNGYTLTGKGELLRFDALLIDQGKIVAAGKAADLSGKAGAAKAVDGQGRTLLPGLIDAHGHVIGLGFNKLQIDLADTATLADALQRVKQYAAQHPGTGWLRGRGWNQVIWKLGRFPTAAELDAAVPDRPVWLRRVDGHAGWANALALKQAGISRDTADPAGGRIERDAKGEPTGVLVDGAMALLTGKMPPATEAETAAALDASLAELARVGVTSVHDAGADSGTIALYRRYADQGKLSARLYVMISDAGKDFDQLSKDGPLQGYGHDFLTVRSVKLYADGALGSRGAALIEPYSDAPDNRGLLFHPPAEMNALIAKAVSRGYQVNVHAIGDNGNREVLDGFAAAYKAHPEAKALRNRIEHAQVVALADIPRFKELGLIASMQPTHATSDMNMAEDRVGPERIKGAYAWRLYLKQGTVIAAGSDFPVESPNPFFGLHAAVTRQDHHNLPAKGWYPGQAMTMTEALRGFTLDAAYAGHQEKTLGTLEPGKWADFIVIDRDIFKVPPSEIWQTQVLETWVGGKRVR